MRQGLELPETLAFEQNAVAEHSHQHPFQAIVQHREDVMQDEWLTSGQKEFLHP